MNPLYLGSRQRRIFAIHEPPAVQRTRQRAAVLCHPWGNEYVYAHRSMRQLASKLSQGGFHTLRFDFYGTGDSGGDMQDADLAGWQADTASAIEALRDIGDVTRVTLIGMRLGASIAAMTAVRCPGECECLVLWDPVVSGSAYLGELGVRPREAQPDAPDDDEIEIAEVNGFQLSSQMQRDLKELDLEPLLAASPVRALMLVTTQSGATPNGSPMLQLEHIESPSPWQEAVSTAGTLPVRVIQRIGEWLS